MRALFVCSGNAATPSGVTSIVSNQGDSLVRMGVEVEYFPIKGGGMRSYLRHIPMLRRHLRANRYDIVHAHYSLSAYVAALAGARPLVVSLMGSDSQAVGVRQTILRLFNRLCFDHLIVKSQDMADKLGLAATVIPNGLDFARFADMNKSEARRRVGFADDKRYVIWVSNPARDEKNYPLATEAIRLLNDSTVELFVVSSVPHADIPVYMYAADALLLSSHYEGSPNVIKEALYCGLPIVSTDVGDVRERMGDCEGCWLADTAQEMASSLAQAVGFGRTQGRGRVRELDDRVIADQLAALYRRVSGT